MCWRLSGHYLITTKLDGLYPALIARLNIAFDTYIFGLCNGAALFFTIALHHRANSRLLNLFDSVSAPASFVKLVPRADIANFPVIIASPEANGTQAAIAHSYFERWLVRAHVTLSIPINAPVNHRVLVSPAVAMPRDYFAPLVQAWVFVMVNACREFLLKPVQRPIEKLNVASAIEEHIQFVFLSSARNARISFARSRRMSLLNSASLS